MRAAVLVSGRIGVRDVGKKKAPARGFLRAPFFDDQWVGQGGQLCQTIFRPGINVFQRTRKTSKTKWLPLAGFWPKWIPQSG
jgi:hypothetical protein